MDDEHFALVVDLLHLRPAKVVRLFGALEGQDAAVVDAQVELVALHVLQSRVSCIFMDLKKVRISGETLTSI